MKESKINDPFYHVVYWILVVILLIFIFGFSWGNKAGAFYFISLLLPVIMGTSYFFNYYLVPKFFLKKLYFQFVIYFIYTVIISLFLEMVVLTFTFTFFLEYNFDQINPNASDTLLLTTVMYLIVFFSSFLLMAKQLRESKNQLNTLLENELKMKNTFLMIKSERKNVKIFYDEIMFVESLSDKIFLHLVSGKIVETREKISKIEELMPDIFLRIHRSFIINTNKLSRFDYNEVVLGDFNLNIGRTYKKQVLKVLKGK